VPITEAYRIDFNWDRAAAIKANIVNASFLTTKKLSEFAAVKGF